MVPIIRYNPIQSIETNAFPLSNKNPTHHSLTYQESRDETYKAKKKHRITSDETVQK